MAVFLFVFSMVSMSKFWPVKMLGSNFEKSKKKLMSGPAIQNKCSPCVNNIFSGCVRAGQPASHMRSQK